MGSSDGAPLRLQMGGVGLLLGGIQRSLLPGRWSFPVHVRVRDVMMIDVVVHVVGVRWWIVDHLVVDDLWLGELEDDHGGRQDHRQQTQGHCLPGLEGDQGQGEGNQHGRFELDAQQEGNHDFLNKATACKGMKHERYHRKVTQESKCETLTFSDISFSQWNNQFFGKTSLLEGVWDVSAGFLGLQNLRNSHLQSVGGQKAIDFVQQADNFVATLLLLDLWSLLIVDSSSDDGQGVGDFDFILIGHGAQPRQCLRFYALHVDVGQAGLVDVGGNFSRSSGLLLGGNHPDDGCRKDQHRERAHLSNR